MKAVEGRTGRVFVLRLEDGDVVPDAIEEVAAEKGVITGYVLLIGGISGGQVVVGPRQSAEMPPEPMLLPIDGAHEVAGVGILAPGEDGRSHLHIHAALGRSGQTKTGCLRYGASTWLVGEAVLFEVVGAEVKRVTDAASGFALLDVKA